MTSNELRAKTEAAQAKVEKIKKTIERHNAKAAKLKKKINSLGWNENDKYQMRDTEAHHECYWMICDYEGALEDAKNAAKKLEDAQRILAGWENKLMVQTVKENLIATVMPEVFRQLQSDLAKGWAAHEIRLREEMITKKSELSYEEFRAIYTYPQEMALRLTDEEIIKSCEQSAEAFIIDLYNRVKAVTGEVTSWAGITYGGKALNGYVYGEEGNVYVETILAGGYNIQRLHNRVLVKRV